MYPDIKIEPSYVPAAQFPSVLMTQLQAGTAPDLFTIQAGGASAIALYALGSQGKLLDLSGSRFWSRTPKLVRKYLLVKRRRYAFAAGFQTGGIFYNRDVFSRLGLKVPTTTTELLALCSR